MLATSWPGPCTRGKAFFSSFLHRQGGGLRLTRSSLPSGDTCSLVVALRIATSARFCGVRHASQRAPLARNSCREVRADDVTRTPNLRGFPCRPPRAYRPVDPLRACCEQNTRRAACGDSHTRSHVDPSVPNSHNTRLHFRRPRGRLVSNVERSRAGLQSRRRVCAGRARNVPWTSYAPSREPGAVSKLTLCGPPGSPFVSPVWIGPCTIPMHALTHTMTLAFCTHFNTLAPLIHFTTHSGTITSGIRVNSRNPGVSIPPKNSAWTRWHHSPAQPRSARPDSPRRDLLRESEFSPSVPKEAILMLAPGPDTFPMLNLIVPF